MADKCTKGSHQNVKSNGTCLGAEAFSNSQLASVFPVKHTKTLVRMPSQWRPKVQAQLQGMVLALCHLCSLRAKSGNNSPAPSSNASTSIRTRIKASDAPIRRDVSSQLPLSRRGIIFSAGTVYSAEKTGAGSHNSDEHNGIRKPGLLKHSWLKQPGDRVFPLAFFRSFSVLPALAIICNVTLSRARSPKVHPAKKALKHTITAANSKFAQIGQWRPTPPSPPPPLISRRQFRSTSPLPTRTINVGCGAVACRQAPIGECGADLCRIHGSRGHQLCAREACEAHEPIYEGHGG